jgi:3-oxo-5alpha-steroid 4-dehydrogenase
VPAWNSEYDVVVVGHGVAGGGAAIEAAQAGADVVVLERMSRGGGATALSTGITYFGGGTSVQKACGFEDSVEDMSAYVRLAAGQHADPERVRLYCENSLEHFQWFVDLGVPFNDSFHAAKTTHPFTDECLSYSGNEEAWPFCDAARPVPRGHKPAQEGEAGGLLMEAVIAGTAAAGAKVVADCKVERLVTAADDRVVGVIAVCERERIFVKARRGVVLACGGFIKNREMVAHYAPHLLQCNYPVATDGDDGSGILMGMAAGGEAVNMSEGLVLNPYYPPESHLKGVLVDGRGQRFINEDAYLGRSSDAIVFHAQGRAYLVVDDEIHGQTQAFHKIAAVEESFEDLERALELPPGSLVATMHAYNAAAAEGRDPAYHKRPKHLRPLLDPPFGALDCSTDNSIFGVFTLGGLRVTPTGEVLDGDAVPITGLWAAGRCTAGLPREGKQRAPQ